MQRTYTGGNKANCVLKFFKGLIFVYDFDLRKHEDRVEMPGKIKHTLDDGLRESHTSAQDLYI